MFDFNPFREYKKMMKAKRLAESTPYQSSREIAPGGGGTTPRDDTGPPPPTRPHDPNQISQLGPPPMKTDSYVKMVDPPWVVVNNEESTAEELHDAVRGFFSKQGAGMALQVTRSDGSAGERYSLPYPFTSSKDIENFYNALRNHRNATGEHINNFLGRLHPHHAIRLQ